MTDHYATLGIGRDATAAQIRAAYRRQAQAFHPDRGGSNARMSEINRAFAELSDPARRAHADRVLAALDPELDGIRRLVAGQDAATIRRVLKDVRQSIASYTQRDRWGNYGGPLNSPQLALLRRQAMFLEELLA